MRPGRELQRAINLEQVRLTWHNEQMRQVYQAAMDAVNAPSSSTDCLDEGPPERPGAVAADVHVYEATFIGAILLATLMPDAWSLPYGVVTEPVHSARPLA